MTATEGKTASPRNFAAVTIILVSTLSLFTITMPTSTPKVSLHNPTATFNGYLSVSLAGVYHYVDTQPLCGEVFPPCIVTNQPVFYLTTKNGTDIQLVFYCGDHYCDLAQQIHLSEGGKISVDGTLMVPSRWPTSEYQPTLYFIADLYVFNYTAA